MPPPRKPPTRQLDQVDSGGTEAAPADLDSPARAPSPRPRAVVPSDTRRDHARSRGPAPAEELGPTVSRLRLTERQRSNEGSSRGTGTAERAANPSPPGRPARAGARAGTGAGDGDARPSESKPSSAEGSGSASSSAPGPAAADPDAHDADSDVDLPDVPADEAFLCLRVARVPAEPGRGKDGPDRGAAAVVRRVVAPGPDEELKIGRHWRCGLVLDDGEISSEHVALRWSEASPSGWVAVDLGSLNGSFLNGETIGAAGRVRGTERPLARGDVLKLATRTEVRVSFRDDEGAETWEMGHRPAASRPGGPLAGGRAAAMLRRANQGPTMRRKDDDGPVGYPFFVTADALRGDAAKGGAGQADGAVAINSEEGGAASFVCPSLGLLGSLRIREGVEHTRKGRPCEDQIAAIVPGSTERPLSGAFLVLDGHFGTRAAIIAKHRISQRVRDLMARPPESEADGAYRDALERLFRETDEVLAQQCEEGSTCTLVLMWREGDDVLMQCANVGDSFAAVVPLAPGPGGGPPPPAYEITTNHRVDQDGEFDRIEALGLPPAQLGGYQRGHTRLLGFQLARCLGDKLFKVECPGIVSDPSTSQVVRAPPGGCALIVASDGIWDSITLDEAAPLVRKALATPVAGELAGLEQLCDARDALVEEVLTRNGRDDISICVALVSPGHLGEAFTRQAAMLSHRGASSQAAASSGRGSGRLSRGSDRGSGLRGSGIRPPSNLSKSQITSGVEMDPRGVAASRLARSRYAEGFDGDRKSEVDRDEP